MNSREKVEVETAEPLPPGHPAWITKGCSRDYVLSLERLDAKTHDGERVSLPCPRTALWREEWATVSERVRRRYDRRDARVRIVGQHPLWSDPETAFPARTDVLWRSLVRRR